VSEFDPGPSALCFSCLSNKAGTAAVPLYGEGSHPSMPLVLAGRGDLTSPPTLGDADPGDLGAMIQERV